MVGKNDEFLLLLIQSFPNLTVIVLVKKYLLSIDYYVKRIAKLIQRWYQLPSLKTMHQIILGLILRRGKYRGCLKEEKETF